MFCSKSQFAKVHLLAIAAPCFLWRMLATRLAGMRGTLQSGKRLIGMNMCSLLIDLAESVVSQVTFTCVVWMVTIADATVAFALMQ